MCHNTVACRLMWLSVVTGEELFWTVSEKATIF